MRYETRRQCGRCFDWLNTAYDFATPNDPFCRRCMEASYSDPHWREELGHLEGTPVFRAAPSEVFRALWEEQRGRCAICGKNDVALCIDHDHDTDRVRGLLCSSCNMGLGHFHDRTDLLMTAKAYLERNRHRPLPYLYAEAKKYMRRLKEPSVAYMSSKS